MISETIALEVQSQYYRSDGKESNKDVRGGE